MESSTTGRKRLRAGLPQGWSVGDKTGTSGNGAANDVAFALPPGRKPILIAAYVNAPGANAEALDAAHRAIARAVTSGAG